MKLKLVILLVSLVTAQLVKAQVVSEVQFGKAVDYVNCKLVELSLKQVSPPFIIKCDCDTYPKYDSIIASIPIKQDATILLSNEIQKVKLEYKPSMTSDSVIKLLSNSIFEDNKKYKTIYKFAEKREKETAFSELKNQIRVFLSAQLSGSNMPSKTEAESSASNDNISISEQGDSTSEPTVSDDSGWFDGFTFQIDVFAILISIFIFCFLFVKVNSKTSRSEFLYLKDKFNAVRNSSNSNPVALTHDIRPLKNEIDELRQELKRLSRVVENSKLQSDNKSRNSTENPAQTAGTFIESKSAPEIFYLSTPNGDGSFDENSAHSNYREGATIYKFIKTSFDKADFLIDERDQSVKLALQYPDKNIDPVCEAQNAFNPKAKKIVTLKDGVGSVQLIGDKWKVTRKAKISYEN